MANPKRGLGKGLDSLIPTSTEKKVGLKTGAVATEKGPVTMVNITKIEPNRDQPRKMFNEEALQELADSIKQHGLLEPIMVQDRKDHYEIILGERRWRASKLAGLKEMPVIIKNLSEQEIVEISLIENIQREDLNPIEEAQAYKRLMDEFHLTQEEVSKRVNKSRTAVANSMRLLKLDDRVQQMVIDGANAGSDEKIVSTGHARALLAIDNKDRQYEIAQKIVSDGLTVRDIEKLVKDITKPLKESKEKKKKKALEDVFYRNIEEQLITSLGTKVAINAKDDGSGKIEIDFYSGDELDRIYQLLLEK
ncbi:MAG: ParB/RepB/Spo0J family partition protein [Lachnospiraceae bacterium]|nr:ParB/RepB/Spo0J family partition protein [Lachnospiraceae bacterium]